MPPSMTRAPTLQPVLATAMNSSKHGNSARMMEINGTLGRIGSLGGY